MSYSFDPSLVNASDSVRSLLQDNQGEAVAILTDEEINANLASSGWNDGLALCATSIASAYAKRASSYKAGSTDAEFEWSERVAWYEEFAKSARKGAYPPPSLPVRLVSSSVATAYRPSCGYRRWRDELL